MATQHLNYFCSLKSKDLFAVCILQQIMGTGPFIKYGDNRLSKLGKAVCEAIPEHAYAVSTLYIYR